MYTDLGSYSHKLNIESTVIIYKQLTLNKKQINKFITCFHCHPHLCVPGMKKLQF